MIFQELIDKYKFSEVWPRFIELYPDQNETFDGYNWVYNVELKKEPVYGDEKIKINIDFSQDDENYTYWDVSGVKEESDQKWAIELESFRHWAGYEIPQELLNKMNEIDIICHCLYETTFFGYSEEEKQEFVDQLNKSYEEVLKQIKEKETKDAPES